jgi:hypothetical protein
VRTVAQIRRGILNGTIPSKPVEITKEEACCFLQMKPDVFEKRLAKNEPATFMGRPAVIVSELSRTDLHNK